MESGAVIEGFDVVEDGSAGLSECGEAVMIDQFVFEAAKEAFDKSVIGIIHSAIISSNPLRHGKSTLLQSSK